MTIKFSKALSPSIRMGYMVLEKFEVYNSTVRLLNQYVIARYHLSTLLINTILITCDNVSAGNHLRNRKRPQKPYNH
ncbi:hypothetical protein ADH70_008130 [Blautia pseudococcoides]|uniref:Uncharacterized protein n=1 Tax=Blautia pseudococcoides TaxID=1796616 RepID=A0A1V0QEM8_9FIRM|nr:hypothetical protein A4V09_24065 [Blautia pseudococcoides]ASU28817.1 hypothetical protein ADH70_008130 [Blautia pseudococcoides]